MKYKNTYKEIKKAKKIYIVGHVNPDGDSIGACFSLALALRKIKKDVNVIMSSHSHIFDFFPHINDVKCSIDEEIDLLILVDASEVSRTVLTEYDMKNVKNVIKIDHHRSNVLANECDIVDSTSPATCQIIYEFLKDIKVKIDKDIAMYIYAGIVTDTGSFNYSATTKRTLEIASKLVATGFDFSYVCRKLNDTMHESKLKLIAETVKNMETYLDGDIRYSFVPYSFMIKNGIGDEDAEGMSNYLRKIEGTKIAVYVRENSKGKYKVSLRSNEDVDLSDIAIHFNGGGHKRAAGYTMDLDKDYNSNKEDLFKKMNEKIINLKNS